MAGNSGRLKLALILGGLYLLLAVLFGALAAVLWSDMQEHERLALVAIVMPRLELSILIILLAWFFLGLIVSAIYRAYVMAPLTLREQALVMVSANPGLRLQELGAPEIRTLAQVVNSLAEQREALQRDVESRVREGRASIEEEKNRLAALMSELTQSVVVCNLDGRILLYNSRARTQFRALSSAPSVSGGAELIGLGRSIYTVFDRALIAHALESVQQRLQRGAAHPSAQFVTGTRAGQLLRVQMAPVREIDAAPGEVSLNGFVLMLENITRDFADESERDTLLHGLTEGSRASLGNLQAAVELLDDEGIDAATRERFHGVIRDEVRAMSRRIQELASHTAQTMKTRWPLEDMLGADLLAAAARRIEAQCGCRVSTAAVDGSLWLKVDSFSLLQALVYLAQRLVDEYELKSVSLRLAEASGRARLDLAWIGATMSTEIVMGWETDAMRIGSETLALSVRDVVERHDGAFWFERERVRHESFFRWLLPLAASSEQLDAAQIVKTESRPEVYDFDLFRASEQSRELAERPLAELAYTVFDTETTGLNPGEGDEIIQIGATRIVAGKLRREDVFDQLVDPQRTIPEAGIPIHGITPEMVQGAPTIAAVLPAFHAFAQETVLVAHNAAFDMRFLELKQRSTGIVFDQPVLDTLLLSAVVHPQQESHRLEAIAERLGVNVLGRHTAVGDAMVTAEIFLKLIPLLAERGIHTLGQAREAAQQTYYARVSY